ncbi:MAG: anthranilate synthase component I family protein [Egibacteraceae bacterium]
MSTKRGAGPLLPAAELVRGPVDPLALAGLPGLRAPAVVTVRGWTVVVADPVTVVDSLQSLDELGARCGWREPAQAGLPPFTGGAVGYLSDDLSPAWLALPPDTRPATAQMPPLWLGWYDGAVCIAPCGEEVWLVARDVPGSSRSTPGARLRRLRGLVEAARAAGAAPIVRPPERPRPVRVRPSLDRAAHTRGVRQTLEWIAAGDLYQLNLTLQLAVGWRAGGVSLARQLWAASPGAAHGAWLAPGGSGGVEIVSVSPETFLRGDGDQVTVRPIKGTRPRGHGRDDDAHAAALTTSGKDAAEHVMIVDLERNDLGRVCVPGSVTVPELMALEAHPTVWHLTSTVTGRLRDDVGLAELFAATFPSGSVTGAPKRMAVARAALLEPVRRGVYCGAIGVVSRGLLDFSVAIRTAVLTGGLASYGTGGGIVAESDPDMEWDEAMDKAAAFFHATNTLPP